MIDTQSNSKLNTLSNIPRIIKTILFVKNSNQVWVGTNDKRLIFIHADTFELLNEIQVESTISCLLYFPGVIGGTPAVFSGSPDGCLCVWNVTNQSLEKKLLCHTRAINSVCVVGSQSLWSASDDKTIRVTTLDTWDFNKKLVGHADYVNLLVIVGHRVWSCSEDKTIIVWDTRTFKFLKRIHHERSVKSLSYLPLREVVCAGTSGGIICIYDSVKFDLLRRFASEGYGVNCLFANKAFVWVAHVDQTVSMWDIDKEKKVSTFKLLETYSVNFVYEEEVDHDDLMDDEMRKLFDFINARLTGTHMFVEDYLPIETRFISTCMRAIRNGVVLCTFIWATVPSLLDMRVVAPKASLKTRESSSNINLCLNAARILGCDTSDIRVPHFEGEKVDIVFPFVWQLVDACLFTTAMKKFVSHPQDYIVLLQPGEEFKKVEKLPPADILLRWVNYHLIQANSKRKISNFSTDIKDGEVYHIILTYLTSDNNNNNFTPQEYHGITQLMVLIKQHQVAPYIQPRHILEGHHLLNISFVADLFVKFPIKRNHPLTRKISLVGQDLTVEDLTGEDQRASSRNLLSLIPPKTPPIEKQQNDTSNHYESRRNSWANSKSTSYTNFFKSDMTGVSQSTQKRTITSWINNYKLEPFVNDIFEDLKDGIILLKLLDKLYNIVDWRKATLTPDNKWQRIENCNYVVYLCSVAGINLRGIVGRDIEEGTQNLTMGKNTKF